MPGCCGRGNMSPYMAQMRARDPRADPHVHRCRHTARHRHRDPQALTDPHRHTRRHSQTHTLVCLAEASWTLAFPSFSRRLRQSQACDRPAEAPDHGAFSPDGGQSYGRCSAADEQSGLPWSESIEGPQRLLSVVSQFPVKTPFSQVLKFGFFSLPPSEMPCHTFVIWSEGVVTVHPILESPTYFTC